MIQTLDREQIKRDAADFPVKAFSTRERTLARHCRALLAALDLVERERNQAVEREGDLAAAHDGELERAIEAETRLAKVPALVEAVRALVDQMGAASLHDWHGPIGDALVEALADYEGE